MAEGFDMAGSSLNRFARDLTEPALPTALRGVGGGTVACDFAKLSLPQFFGSVFGTTAVAAGIPFLRVKPIRRLMGGVH